MPMRRPILLAAAAVAAFSAGPAFAQASLPVIAGGGVYGAPVYGPGPAPIPYDYDYGYEYSIDDAGVDYDDSGYVDDYASPPPRHGDHREGYDRQLPPQPSERQFAYTAEQREDWLRECRRRYDSDGGLGGALIGGAIGGFAGNRIAGDGNRVVGTVAGAAVGALAGRAIDRAGDERRARDICEDYLIRYEDQGAAYGGYAQGGYVPGGYGAVYGGQVMWVPMVVGWDCKPRKVAQIAEPVQKPARRVIMQKTPPAPARTKTVPIKAQPVKARPAKTVPIKATKSVK